MFTDFFIIIGKVIFNIYILYIYQFLFIQRQHQLIIIAYFLLRISYFQYLNFYSDMRFHTNLPFILGRYFYEFLIHELTIKMITCL